ncbi:MAG TPA: hypothetical protein VK622_09305 [Puia sp.]|nr:hypothetical protein [Puia sp.]
MLFIFGIRNARIGKYRDSDHICYPCKAYDREILIYRSYFHFCLIPVFPVGARKFEIRCCQCGDETKSENIVRQYDQKTKTPLYFYSAWVLFAAIAIFWFYWDKNSQRHKMELVGNPVIGDVYTIKERKNDETNYYFLKITGIAGDTVLAIQNHFDYGDFVNGLSQDDYFVKDDTLIYKRKNLTDMLERDEIFSVSRDYGDGDGFNRVR